LLAPNQHDHIDDSSDRLALECIMRKSPFGRLDSGNHIQANLGVSEG
jgi:hypothetical protein